ncbi:hypothetical protein GbCGDNIH6_8255 [Granulibacter bethesdensis]|nr:hypothetical protein GbCGDNIH6_8255 [Granulibacter bethesdensis]
MSLHKNIKGMNYNRSHYVVGRAQIFGILGLVATLVALNFY